MYVTDRNALRNWPSTSPWRPVIWTPNRHPELKPNTYPFPISLSKKNKQTNKRLPRGCSKSQYWLYHGGRRWFVEGIDFEFLFGNFSLRILKVVSPSTLGPSDFLTITICTHWNTVLYCKSVKTRLCMKCTKPSTIVKSKYSHGTITGPWFFEVLFYFTGIGGKWYGWHWLGQGMNFVPHPRSWK